jgi:hypothetical protein
VILEERRAWRVPRRCLRRYSSCWPIRSERCHWYIQTAAASTATAIGRRDLKMSWCLDPVPVALVLNVVCAPRTCHARSPNALSSENLHPHSERGTLTIILSLLASSSLARSLRLSLSSLLSLSARSASLSTVVLLARLRSLSNSLSRVVAAASSTFAMTSLSKRTL